MGTEHGGRRSADPAGVAGLAQETLGPLGLVVEDVRVTPAGKRRLVRVLLDRDLSGLVADETSSVSPLSLDEVADATRELSAALDDSEVMGQAPYVLEVSSPGVERPLLEPRHYRRNVGRLVVVTRGDGSALAGRITAAGPDTVTLEVPATKTEPARTEHLPYADLSRAQVQVEFSRGDQGEDR